MKGFFDFLIGRRGRARNPRAEIRRIHAKQFFKQVWQNKSAFIGTVVVAFFLLMAIFGPLLVKFDISAFGASSSDAWLPPSGEHLLGTDALGRDILAFIVTGSRVSMLVAVTATVISMVLGTLIGLISGYCGGWIDMLLMRMTDFFLSIPWLPLCMVLASMLGSSVLNIILVIGFTSWSGTARIVRAQTLSVKEQQYVERTTSIGAKNGHIMMKHILPNVFPIIFSETVLIAASAIGTETTLSFLGLGDTTQPSWGMILYYANATGSVSKGAWWYFIPAGLCVVLVVLGFSLMGYAFDEILNPKLKER